MATVVYNVIGVNKAFAANGGTAKGIFTVRKKAKTTIYTKGGGSTYYLDNKLVVNGRESGAKLLFDGINKDPKLCSFIEVTKSMIDPESPESIKNRGDEPLKKNTQITTTIGKSATFGKIIEPIDAEYLSIIKTMGASGEITLKTCVKDDGTDIWTIVRTVMPMVKRFNSNSEKVKIEYRGQPIVDPQISIHADFAVYPPAFGKLAGRVKTIIRDYNKPMIVGNKVIYEEATVNIDGIDVPICETNVHKFVTRGSKIHRAYFSMNSTSVSDKYVSSHINIDDMVIEPGCADAIEVVGDEEDESFDVIEVSNDVSPTLPPKENVLVTSMAALAVMDNDSMKACIDSL